MSFAVELERFADGAKKSLDAKCREITLHLFRGVILKSPVDTGRLRGSWGVGVTPTPGPQDSMDKTGSQSLGRVVAALKPGVFIGGGMMTLMTNLPYAHRIEFDGWSHTKAPAGMARLALAETVAKYGR
ncbi:HK97 gp10 family phage protein [Chromobacterium haemolyticum]|uniref:HK97 gp10 family phage protein n=1 Tax=Chromobacterium haemolyticum TaxID=394935 RepID=UPI0013179A12|nr:HK97 gp10 family phage protein [Chromobacterium haemolyticum]BBH12908.1 hypothetical protein CH06BL_21560 [Chromobacterium haemolyticum]